jgi:hypothetical protein
MLCVSLVFFNDFIIKFQLTPTLSYLAAEKMRETGFSTTAPLQLEAPPAPAAGGSAASASGAAASDAAAVVVSGPADPGALSVLVHAGGFVYMTETAEFPALLRDVRRDSLRLVKDCLSVKKASDSETDEVRLSKLEEIGCRVLHVFAMELVFHESVLSAFREKVSMRRTIALESPITYSPRHIATRRIFIHRTVVTQSLVGRSRECVRKCSFWRRKRSFVGKRSARFASNASLSFRHVTRQLPRLQRKRRRRRRTWRKGTFFTFYLRDP